MKPLRALFSVDLELPSAACNLRGRLTAQQAAALDSRLPEQFQVLFERIRSLGLRATWFVQGPVAERYPELLDRLAEAEQPIACHGYRHLPVRSLGPGEFSEDLLRARAALSPWLPQRPGYRAPSFSLDWQAEMDWLALAAAGFAWSSSVMRARAGGPALPAELSAGRPWREPGSGVLELPLGGRRLAGLPLAWGGGFWLRVLPLSFNIAGLKSDCREGRLAHVYLHPWELDAGQPRVVHGWRGLRHYTGMRGLSHRLEVLAQRFELVPLGPEEAVE